MIIAVNIATIPFLKQKKIKRINYFLLIKLN